MKGKFRSLLHPLVLLSIIAYALSLYLLGLIGLLFGLLYFLVILLAINFISPTFTKFLMGVIISELKNKSRLGVEIIGLPEKFEKTFEKSEGFFLILTFFIQYNFLALLLIIRVFGLVGSNLREIYISFIIAMIIAALTAFIIVPIAISVYALEGGRFREYSSKKLTMDYPAYYYRRIIKSIFGYGNLVVLLWLLLDLLQITGFNIAYSLYLYFLILLLAFSSVSFGSFLALLFNRYMNSKVIPNIMQSLNSQLEPLSTPHDKWLEDLRNILTIEETQALKEVEEPAPQGETEQIKEEREQARQGGEENEKEEESPEGKEEEKEEKEN